MDASTTYARSLDLLARAPRSVRDLRRRLLLKGEPEAEVDATIERLTAAGLLNDAAYARAFVRSKVSSQGFSRRRLQQELAKRGVARDVADAAIVEAAHQAVVDDVAHAERIEQVEHRAGPLAVGCRGHVSRSRPPGDEPRRNRRTSVRGQGPASRRQESRRRRKRSAAAGVTEPKPDFSRTLSTAATPKRHSAHAAAK